MFKKLALVLAATMVLVMLFTACAPVATPAPAAEKPAAPAAPKEKIFLAMAMHHNIPYVMQIKSGFDDFCAQYKDDVTCEFSAPNQIDPEQSIAMFQNFVTKGAKGVIVNCVPADTWEQPIKTAIEESGGKLLVNSVDCVCNKGSDANVQVGPLYEPQGKEFAKAFFDALAKKGVTSGQVVFGYCAPGYDSQEKRNKTFLDECKARGTYDCVGSLDSGHAADLNYAFWENANTKYPKAVAFAGSCAFDGPNLFKLKKQTGAKWWIGTYDLEPETLDGLKAGDILVGIGNNPHLCGWLAGQILMEHLKSGKPLAKGAVLSNQSEIVTYETINDFMSRESSHDARLAYTKDLLAADYGDIDALIQPLP